MTKDLKTEKVKIGKITGVVGLKGEIKIFHYADEPEQLKSCNLISIDNQEYNMESIRYKKKIPIIKLNQIEDRNAAEELIGKEIYINNEKMPKLPKDSYYVKDLYGMNVVLETGVQVGILQDVIFGTAQDNYEIECEDKKRILLPAVSDFILNIDLEQKKITVRLPHGIEDIKY